MGLDGQSPEYFVGQIGSRELVQLDELRVGLDARLDHVPYLIRSARLA